MYRGIPAALSPLFPFTQASFLVCVPNFGISILCKIELESGAMKESRTRVLTAIGAVAVLIAVGIQYWLDHRVTYPQSPTVVVLPAKVSGDASQAFLTDAVAATLSEQLKGISGIELKTPPTSSQFEQVSQEPKRVALSYDANLAVATSIEASGDQYKLGIQLVDPMTGRVLWNRSFPATSGQYLDLIHTAGEAIRRELRSSSAPLTPLTVNGGAEAELAYREGEYHMERFTSRHDFAEAQAALEAFKRAFNADPKRADTAANLARLTDAENWTRQAIEIDPKCGRAFWFKASADPAHNLPDALRGAMFAPDFAPAQLTLSEALASSSTLGLLASRQARQIAPLFLAAPLAEAGFLHQLGRTSEAFAILDRHVLSIDPDLGYGRLVEVSLMIELGWLDRAQPVIDRIKKDVAENRIVSLPSDPMAQKFNVAQKEFAGRGINVKGLMEVIDNPAVTPLQLSVAVESIPALVQGGDIDEAFKVLTRAQQIGMAIPYDWLRTDRRLDKLRKESRFGPINNRSRDQFEEMIKILDEAKSRGELPQYLQQAIADVRTQVGN